MLSKMLSFHKGLFIQTMRSASWIGVLYFVCLFFILPLQVMMMYSRGEWTYPYETKSLLAVTPEFQMVLVFTIPVLLAIFLFRFLHIKGAADYIHSLPVHREAIYWQSVWYGLILLVVPVLLNGFIMGILREVLRIHDLYSIESIVSWTVLMICFSTFVFMAAVLMGMLTGISVLQGFFLFVFILFPAGISLLVLTNLALQLHGFAIDYYMSINFGRLVPFVRFLESVNTPITAVEWTIYSILIGLFFIAALFIYKARPTESAGQAIAFRKIRPLFMYGFTLCATLVGGVYFGIIQDSPDWVFFGYLCGSLAGYFFAAVVLEKTWRVFHQWKGYILFLAVFVVLGFAVRLDLLGYEDTLPDLSEIERAYISSSVYGLTSEKLNGEIDSRGVFHEQEPSDYYQTGENIQHIYGYHQAVMKAGEIQPSKHSTPKIFAYELKNGEKFVRQYNIVESQYESYMGPIA
ncbi:MAG TPA: hypothetical protein VEY51_05695, partial [Chondromyces sp.]|nr:hypothetical protein [Chondromyces sp.]